MLRGDMCLVFAYNAFDDSNNFQRLLRVDRLVVTVCSFEIFPILSLSKVFHRSFSIHFSDYNVSNLGLVSTLHNDEVTWLNTGIDHRVSFDA